MKAGGNLTSEPDGAFFGYLNRNMSGLPESAGLLICQTPPRKKQERRPKGGKKLLSTSFGTPNGKRYLFPFECFALGLAQPRFWNQAEDRFLQGPGGARRLRFPFVVVGQISLRRPGNLEPFQLARQGHPWQRTSKHSDGYSFP